VVFVVGIYDFGGAFNQKQKIEQAAQEGAIVAGAQPTTDLFSDGTSNTDPPSLLPVATAVTNSLYASGVTSAICKPGTGGAGSGLTWTFHVKNCSSTYPSDDLTIVVNRGWVCSSGGPCGSAPPPAVGTTVTVTFPYHWRFNSVIQLLFPNAAYAVTTDLTEASTVHNQM
jgi:hypothetical protein